MVVAALRGMEDLQEGGISFDGMQNTSYFRPVAEEDPLAMRSMSTAKLEQYMEEFRFKWSILEKVEEIVVLICGISMGIEFSCEIARNRKWKTWCSIVSHAEVWASWAQ